MTPIVDERIINPATSMGAVTLNVGDLETMSGYYARAFVMEQLEEATRGHEVHRVLGRGQTPLVRLVQTPNLPALDPRQSGLFHTAFLFDTPENLAATVYRAAQEPNTRFTGSSDHTVSDMTRNVAALNVIVHAGPTAAASRVPMIGPMIRPLFHE